MISADTAIIVLISEIKTENIQLKEENSRLIQMLESLEREKVEANLSEEVPDVPEEAPDSTTNKEQQYDG